MIEAFLVGGALAGVLALRRRQLRNRSEAQALGRQVIASLSGYGVATLSGHLSGVLWDTATIKLPLLRTVTLVVPEGMGIEGENYVIDVYGDPEGTVLLVSSVGHHAAHGGDTVEFDLGHLAEWNPL